MLLAGDTQGLGQDYGQDRQAQSQQCLALYHVR